MKFTFKTNKPTGRYRSFESPEHLIKLGGKEVGSITDGTWKIRLMVKKDPSPRDPAPFKWITLKGAGRSLADCKEFLNLNVGALERRYNLYKM